MPVSVQHILDPRAVLDSADMAVTEEALYAPALCHDANVLVLERDSLRLQFNFRALAEHLADLAARETLHGVRVRESGATLTAPQLADALRHAPPAAQRAGGQCLRDLARMQEAGFDGIVVATFKPVEIVHMNTPEESVVCNLWGEAMTLPYPSDIENKRGSFFDPSDSPRLKQNARVFTARPGSLLRFSGLLHTACSGVWHGHKVTATPAVSLQGHKITSFL